MSYLVLARKWRPTRFDDVVGQEHITQTLQNAIRRDRVPHALLFIGSRGVGKTSCARIFAKALNCLSEAHPVPVPCDQCQSCLSVNQGNAVDVFEIDGASNNGVEQVRELRESTRFTPSISRFKIYIIDEVHMLSVGAFNALLKTLEEPPAHVKFIFATTEPHKIPDTIISRCQRFDFKRIQSQDIVGALDRICAAEAIKVERAALEHVAREAQGGMRDSLSLLDQLISFCGEEITELKTREIFGLTSREMMLSLISAVLRQDAAEVINLLNTHANAGADIKRLSTELLELLRDLMVIKVHNEPEKILTLPPSELEQAQLAAQNFQVGAIHQVFQTLIGRADEIQRSPHPKLLLEMSLIQMCHQADTATVSEVMTGLLSLEQHLNQVGLGAGLPPLAPPPQFRPLPQFNSVSTENLIENKERDSVPQIEVNTVSEPNENFNKAQSLAIEAAPNPLKFNPSHTPNSDKHVQQDQLTSSEKVVDFTEPISPPKMNLIEPVTEYPHLSGHSNEKLANEKLANEKLANERLANERRANERPRHPMLPADPDRIPVHGQGINDRAYQWFSAFNQWLGKQDSFVAAEMRLKMRYIYLQIEATKIHIIWGGPVDLIELFESKHELITQQLMSEAQKYLELVEPIQHLQLDLKRLSPDAPELQFESMTEYAKRKRAQLAIQQIESTITEEFISDHVKALGGQVIYVIPQVLNAN